MDKPTIKIEVPIELIKEAQDMLQLSYIKNGVDAIPDYMKKQKKLVEWATKTALLISNIG